MLPLGTAWAAARKSRKNGGFLRFLTRYRGILDDLSRPAKPGLSFAVHGQPVPDRCPLPTRFARRIAVAGCRITASGLRAGMFGAWAAGHGAA